MPVPHEASPSQHPEPQVAECLSLLQAFAATADTPGQDALGTRDDAVRWLREEGLLADGSGLMNSEYNALVRLRQALRDVLAAHAGGRDDAGAAARMTKGLADGRLVVTVGPDAAIQLNTAARASYPAIVASLAVAVARAAAAGRWPGTGHVPH